MTKPYPYKVYRTLKHKNLHRLINVHGRFYTHCIALHKRYYRLFGQPGTPLLGPAALLGAGPAHEQIGVDAARDPVETDRRLRRDR